MRSECSALGCPLQASYWNVCSWQLRLLAAVAIVIKPIFFQVDSGLMGPSIYII